MQFSTWRVSQSLPWPFSGSFFTFTPTFALLGSVPIWISCLSLFNVELLVQLLSRRPTASSSSSTPRALNIAGRSIVRMMNAPPSPSGRSTFECWSSWTPRRRRYGEFWPEPVRHLACALIFALALAFLYEAIPDTALRHINIGKTTYSTVDRRLHLVLPAAPLLWPPALERPSSSPHASASFRSNMKTRKSRERGSLRSSPLYDDASV